jgi:Flp pilus assembly pilin Flp
MNMTFSECRDLLNWARKRQEGQTMAEYAVILGVIAAVIVLAIGTLSTAISGAITSVAGLM